MNGFDLTGPAAGKGEGNFRWAKYQAEGIDG